MSQVLNQFGQTQEQGRLDGETHSNVITCKLSTNEAGTVVPGQAVKMEDIAGGIPQVRATTANTDVVLGFVVNNFKKEAYVAGDEIEVALEGSIMYMTANAAIARGAYVESIYSTKRVTTALGVNPVCGWALDKATAQYDLIRVYIIHAEAPFDEAIASLAVAGAATVGTTLGVTGNTTLGAALAVTGATTLTGGVNGAMAATGAVSGTTLVNTLGVLFPDTSYGVACKRVRLSAAQMNAGASLVAAVTGKKLRLIDCKVIAIGGNAEATANATGVAISGTQGASAVKLFEVDLAQLTRSAVNRVGTASTKVLADGASFVACDAASAITVAPVAGTDLITATHFDVEVTYAIEA